MKKSLILLLVLVVGLAVWRRNALKHDAERAASATREAAKKVSDRLGHAGDTAADAVTDSADVVADTPSEVLETAGASAS